MKKYILAAFGFLFLSIGIYNTDKYNTNKTYYTRKVTTTPAKNDQSIWEYKVRSDEYCQMVSVSEKFLQTSYPIYVGDDIKVPIGGGNYYKENKIYLGTNCNLSNSIVWNQPAVWWSGKTNTTHYYDYSKLIETMNIQYQTDFTQISVGSIANLFIVRDGDKLGVVYLSGYLDDQNRFRVSAVSDDKLLMIENLSYYPTYLFYFFGVITILIIFV